MMKPYQLIGLALLLLSTGGAFAQGPTTQQRAAMSRFLWTNYHFGLGLNNNHFGNMSLDQVMRFAERPRQLQRDLNGFNEEVKSVTYSVGLFFNVGLSPLDRATGTYRQNREVRLGVGLHSPSEAMVSYKDESRDTSLVYCTSHGEFTLEGAYLFKGTWGKRQRWHWYYGVGGSSGFTFSNEVIVIGGKYFGPDEHPMMQETNENSVTRYAAKPVIYSRLYIPYGLHYAVSSSWSVGLDFKTGIGLQTITGEGTEFMERTGAVIIGAKYRFKG